MRPSARELAIGRWPGILRELGVDPKFLTGKHGPCPTCGGEDRFRFDDQGGAGTYICSHCGAGDGFDLIQRILGMEFKSAAKEVERLAGVVPKGKVVSKPPVPTAMLKRIWSESNPLADGDAGMAYLHRRGIPVPSPCPALRTHPGLDYLDEKRRVIGVFPALVAAFQDPAGKCTAIQRTYLGDGHKGKAAVAEPKKTLGKTGNGGAIRLSPHRHILGIAEGIESALAASVLMDIPVWAGISANAIEAWEPPEGVREVVICGDSDLSFTGQKASYVLAYRLHARGFRVSVRFPPTEGVDWADVVEGLGVAA